MSHTEQATDTSANNTGIRSQLGPETHWSHQTQRGIPGGQYWLEVFLLAEVTAVKAQLNMLARTISRIDPDTVQLNTATRPPAEDLADPVPRHQLEYIVTTPYDSCEVIAAYAHEESNGNFRSDLDDIVNLLK